jgi:hypothetical protein
VSSGARALRPAPELASESVVLPLLDAQTCIVESIEGLVRHRTIEFDEIDARLGDAMRKIAEARSRLREQKRAKLGQPTIASTG